MYRSRASEFDAVVRENRDDRPTYDKSRDEAVAASEAIKAKADAAFARNNPREAGASKWDKAARDWIDANPDFKFEDLLAWDDAFLKQGKEARAETNETKRRAASYLVWTEAKAKVENEAERRAASYLARDEAETNETKRKAASYLAWIEAKNHDKW
jgi:hypothetical protein